MKLRITIVVCVVLFLYACGQDTTQPGYEIKMLTDMKEPVPYEAYSKNPVFINQVTQQKPVLETVHREAILTVGDANPIELTTQVLQRGQKIYENFCLVCHGVTGEGDGSLIPKYPNPPSLHSQRILDLKPADVYTIITEGKRDMPSHAGQISEEDRWKLIYYIEKIQGKRP